jgi:hypothetical protein
VVRHELPKPIVAERSTHRSLVYIQIRMRVRRYYARPVGQWRDVPSKDDAISQFGVCSFCQINNRWPVWHAESFDPSTRSRMPRMPRALGAETQISRLTQFTCFKIDRRRDFARPEFIN